MDQTLASRHYCPNLGPFSAKIMFLGKFPGKEEIEQQTPMVGPSGRIIRDICEEVGINIQEVYLANISKYQPPLNDLNKLDSIGVDINIQLEELKQEIANIQPNVILALGDEPLNILTGHDGIYNYRGSILSSNFGRITKVISTIHPAALIPNKGDSTAGIPWIWREIISYDFKRCLDESSTPDINPPSRSHIIARNSLDLFRFHQEYKSINKPSIDIESINCIPVSIAIAYTKHHSLTVPLLGKIGSHRLTDMTTRELAECWKILQEILINGNIIGQNFKYDEFKLSLSGFRVGGILSDTLLKTHTIWPELPSKSLAMQTSLFTREPYYKDEGKEPKIGKFNIDQFFIYNGKDACVTKEIDEVEEDILLEISQRLRIPLVSFYYDYVMKKHKPYLAMENVGFRVDVAKKNELKARYEMMYEKEQDHLEELIGHEINVKSYPDVYNLLYKEMGLKGRKKDPTSEETIVTLLGNVKGKDVGPKKQILNQILEVRRVRDQLSRQINFIPDYDGRCRTSYKITGTETSRTSTNILKKPVRPKKIGLPFHTISKHGRLGRDISSMFICDEGKICIKADASQAEPRIVAVLSEDWKLLEVMQAGKIDIHRRTAALIFNYTRDLNLDESPIPSDKMEKDGPERYTGKTTRNAGNYNVGKHTFMETFNTNAQKYEIKADVSEWRAGQMLELFHSATPKVKGVFHRDIQLAIRENRILVNPFGRPREFFDKIEERSDSIFKEGYAHIPQSTVADLVQSAAIKIVDELGDNSLSYWISENHDSLTFEAPANDWMSTARLIKKHMQTPIDFRTYCTLKRNCTLVIPCDVEVAETDMSKFERVKVDL